MSSASETVRTDLEAHGIHISVSEADRVAYARDLWPRDVIGVRAGNISPHTPGFIAWPKTREDVQKIVRYAAARSIPIVPFGAGSGVCGAVSPNRETIVIDMKRMRAIERIDEDWLTVKAEAGIIGQHLEDRLSERGFTLGHFPSSIYCSTLGGWLAARSAGQCSGRYGKIEDMVDSMEFVDGAGNLYEAERGGKNHDLLPLLIGSEGTLGVITRARLRISHAPAERTFASFAFPSTEAGIEAIRRIYQSGYRPAVARLYDAFDSWLARSKSKSSKKAPKQAPKSIDETFTPSFSGKTLATLLKRAGTLNSVLHAVPDRAYGGALLVLVWEDDQRIAQSERRAVTELADSLGAKDLGEAPARNWIAHRHAMGYRQPAMFAMGAFVDTMEVSAPWSSLWSMYERVRAALAPHVFVMAHFSHAYPDGGSIYFTFAGSSKDDATATAHYDRTWREAMTAVLDAGGSLSHHHGVGRSKAPMMRRELGHAVDWFFAAKMALDPHAILNPGALVPPEST